MLKLEPELLQKLTKAKNYREFLRIIFTEKTSNLSRKKFSYAEFSRRSGFKSRAFARDLILGKKKITNKNVEQVIAGLGLTTTLSDYFKALIAVEEKSFQIKKINYLENLANKRQKLLKSSQTKMLKQNDVNAADLLSDNAPLVYAALGSLEHGASLDEILIRTKLSQDEVHKALQQLIRANVATADQGRFLPVAPHIAIEKLGGDIFFKRDFERLIRKTQKNFDLKWKDPQSLYLASTFCVNKSEMSALKKRLNETIMDFINACEKPEGDQVVELVVSFTD